MAWDDLRNAQTGAIDIFAVRLTATSEVAPGWLTDGAPICTAPGYQQAAQIVSDGAGGAFIAWEDYRNGDPLQGTGGDIYAIRVDGSGNVLPGWLANGKPICSCAGDDHSPLLMPVGVGGAFVVWNDGHLRANRLTGTGGPEPGWPDTGIVVSGPKGVPGRALVCPDGGSGAYVAWEDYRTRPPPPSSVLFYLDVYLQHVTATGAITAGWPASGLPVCTLRQGQLAPTVVPDGAGGVLMSWDDYRNAEGEIYAQRVTPSGALAPGWPANGRLVSTEQGYEAFNRIVGDGLGGAFVAFENFQGEYKVWVQHLTGAGQLAPGWSEFGQPVASTPFSQEQPWLVPSGTGAIVVWTDLRDYFTTLRDIYAQRFAGDAPVPAQVSLVSVRAEPDRVELTWFAPQGAGMRATVYRRSAESDWRAIGNLAADGTGALRHVDREVRPGERYAYRLGIPSGLSEVFTAETWVEIPAALSLALEGLRPNPAQGEVVAAFSLPSADPAMLELLDLSGRRVLAREVGSLGAGRHRLRLDESAAMPAGIYWLRLRQAGQVRSARAVVAR